MWPEQLPRHLGSPHGPRSGKLRMLTMLPSLCGGRARLGRASSCRLSLRPGCAGCLAALPVVQKALIQPDAVLAEDPEAPRLRVQGVDEHVALVGQHEAGGEEREAALLHEPGGAELARARVWVFAWGVLAPAEGHLEADLFDVVFEVDLEDGALAEPAGACEVGEGLEGGEAGAGGGVGGGVARFVPAVGYFAAAGAVQGIEAWRLGVSGGVGVDAPGAQARTSRTRSAGACSSRARNP